MKQLTLLPAMLLLLASCHTSRQMTTAPEQGTFNGDTIITQSLFTDRAGTISEENIQKTLDGSYRLPSSLRVAVVRLENMPQRRSFWNDEDYAKTQQSYLDLFTDKFRQSPKVKSVSLVPDILISKSPSFTVIRETAVRMQSDVVLVYSISSDIYSKYKVFSSPDMKAYATVQLILLDVRTGLIPFSTVITKDYLSKKKKDELDTSEAMGRVQKEAVLAAIGETSRKAIEFLDGRQPGDVSRN